MRAIFAMCFLILSVAVSAGSREKIDAMEIVSMSDPFHKIKKEKPTKKERQEPVFELGGIFENSAKINDSWLEVGSKIEGYELVSIHHDSVALRRDEHIKVLKLFESGALR